MSIYQNFYDLLNTYIFGNSIVTGSYQDLVCILFATICCLVLVSLPFIIIFKIIDFLKG